ncbi:hypothetical protein [Trichloromonas sp.]|uniref:hypothetical protein n=1 Tax=Trichloromonas sp. TaxID=3069249 RepID=UPI002A392C77|nr:hypothetical protein [Trichloromonas sp.]
MAVEDENGKRLALWLTARLTRRLAEHLLGQVASLPHQEQPQASRSRLEQPVSQGVLQTWEQDLALRKKAASSTVTVGRETPQALVESVNVRFHPQGVTLIFLWADSGGRMRFSMSLTELRQWLNLVFRQTCQADWPLDYWPDWMRQSVDFSWAEATGGTLDKMTLN